MTAYYLASAVATALSTRQRQSRISMPPAKPRCFSDKLKRAVMAILENPRKRKGDETRVREGN